MRVGLKNLNLKKLCKFDDHEKNYYPYFYLRSHNFYLFLQRTQKT
jgi:hypothetical protein